MIEIGRTIKKLRMERDISQRELAATAGITPTFLSLIENHRRHASASVLRRIANGLSLPEEVLIWEAVEIPPGLSEKDQRLCAMAKLIVRRFYEGKDGKSRDGATEATAARHH